jgi:hypothetical protein
LSHDRLVGLGNAALVTMTQVRVSVRFLMRGVWVQPDAPWADLCFAPRRADGDAGASQRARRLPEPGGVRGARHSCVDSHRGGQLARTPGDWQDDLRMTCRRRDKDCALPLPRWTNNE